MLRGESVYHLPKFGDDFLQVADAVFFFGNGVFEFAIQALDGGEGDAIRVDGGNAAVALADTKRGAEILRGGADMANGFVLRLTDKEGRFFEKPRKSAAAGQKAGDSV